MHPTPRSVGARGVSGAVGRFAGLERLGQHPQRRDRRRRADDLGLVVEVEARDAVLVPAAVDGDEHRARLAAVLPAGPARAVTATATSAPSSARTPRAIALAAVAVTTGPSGTSSTACLTELA
jgi:hypothetical protein